MTDASGRRAPGTDGEPEPDALANADRATVEGFGEEWSRFDNAELSAGERETIFSRYFSIFPWADLPAAAEGFDAGCGSGRWAALVAGRVGRLHCVDASDAALAVARRQLAGASNCVFHRASVSDLPLAPGSMDFGYSLGVLHHVPDPAGALGACAEVLRPGAPLLVYVYYRFDNRPRWFRAVWRASDLARRAVSRLPSRVRFAASDVVAALVYWPLARTARLLERIGLDVNGLPLSFYRDRTFYVMRNDALDRLGTRLEHRFTQEEIRRMMEAAGLERISFSPEPPYWCAVGHKRG